MADGIWFQIMKVHLTSFTPTSPRIKFKVVSEVHTQERFLNVPSNLRDRLYRVVCQDYIKNGGSGQLSDDERHTLTILVKVDQTTDPNLWYTLLNFGRRLDMQDDAIVEATRFLLHP